MGKAFSLALMGSNSKLQLGFQIDHPCPITPYPALDRKSPMIWVMCCNRNTDMILEGGFEVESLSQVISE